MGDAPLGDDSAKHWVASDDGSGGSKKYHVLMELGRGGTGVVNAAIARGIGGFSKLVVLKTTKPDFESHSDTVKAFLNEARLSSRMNHPNVVQVYEVYQEAGLPVIVMEYLDGQPLGKLLSRALTDARYVTNIGLTILCKVLEALSYAHSLTDFGGRALGIVHRDVTPHNVMVTYDGQVKLLDFGIAKLKLQSNDTQTGVIKGKLGYMSPEQVAGLPLDARADVFAVGVMLWEVVARRRMWSNRGDADIIRELLREKVPSLKEVVADVDPELERICSQALAPGVDDRYSSAEALLNELQQFLAGRGGEASPSTIAELMGRACGDLREQAQGKLERELAKYSASTEENWESDPAESLASFTPNTEVSAGTATQATSATLPRRTKASTASSVALEVPEPALVVLPSPRAGPRRAFWWVAAATLLGGSAWFLARQGWPGPSSSDVAAPPAVASAAQQAPGPAANGAPEAPLPSGVTSVSVWVEPARARVFLDDQLVLNPYRGSHVRDDEVHQLRVEAEGYEPVTRSLRFDVDVDLVFSLRPAPEPPATNAPTRAERRQAKAEQKTAARAARAAAKRAQAAVAEKVKAPDCDPPYYFDDHGIKHYRRECLGN